MAKKPQETEISVLTIDTGEVTFRLLGTTPMLMNRVSEKAKRELLLPSLRKNQAERAASLKHEPVQEFRNAAYRTLDPGSPTRLVLPSGAFKRAIADVAIDMPGAFKSQVGRLTHVNGINVSIYGVPQLHAAVVRTAGPAKTPDVRFRPILPVWACELTVRFVRPLLTMHAVANLVASAGVIIGVGDNRPQKGAASYGMWELVSDDSTEWDAITQSMGTAAQDAALADPIYYDDETCELCEWYDGEVSRRRDAPPPAPRKAKRAEAIQ